MGKFIPTVDTFQDGVIAITSENLVDYKRIQNSLKGSQSFRVRKLYIKTTTQEQALTPLKFKKKDVNGNLTEKYIVNTIDPYQAQSLVLDIDVNDRDFVLDGQSLFDIDLEPNEKVKFYIDVEVLEASEMLSAPSLVDEFMKTYGFFEEYEDEINPDLELNLENYKCK